MRLHNAISVVLLVVYCAFANSSFAASPAAPKKPVLFGGRNVHDVDLITSGALVGKPDPNGVNGATFAMLMKTLTNPMRYDPVLASLDGLRVSLSGYIMPYDTYIKMKQFQLIYAPPACPYCDPPLPSEFVLREYPVTQTLLLPSTAAPKAWS